MSERFTLSIDSEWWVVGDKTIEVNEFGYREDLKGEDKYRGLKKELTEQETVDLLNKQYKEIMDLRWENTKFKLTVSEIVEDLKKAEQTKYAEWIEKELDLELYSNKKTEVLK